MKKWYLGTLVLTTILFTGCGASESNTSSSDSTNKRLSISSVSSEESSSSSESEISLRSSDSSTQTTDSTTDQLEESTAEDNVEQTTEDNSRKLIDDQFVGVWKDENNELAFVITSTTINDGDATLKILNSYVKDNILTINWDIDAYVEEYNRVPAGPQAFTFVINSDGSLATLSGYKFYKVE